MKALTLTQPWAMLVAIGAKRIETRSWGTDYRGEFAIHAAKGFPSDARWFVTEEPFASALGGLFPADLPTGSKQFTEDSLAKVRAKSAEGILPPFEGDFGDYTPGRYGIALGAPTLLPVPIPVRGMLGLWNLPSNVEQAVREQLTAGATR